MSDPSNGSSASTTSKTSNVSELSSWWRDRIATLPGQPHRLVAIALAAIGAVVVAAVAVVSMRGSPPPVEVSLPRAGPVAEEGPGVGSHGDRQAEADVFVHVAGAVARPGVYKLPGGARVTDAIEAAGGPTPEADLNQLNLAAKVGDGDRVFVPRQGEAAPGAASGPQGPATQTGQGGQAGGLAAGPVNLNSATLEQLEALPGVGPATAQAILDYRKEKGRFRSVDELLEVRGIGEAKLAALRSKVRV